MARENSFLSDGVRGWLVSFFFIKWNWWLVKRVGTILDFICFRWVILRFSNCNILIQICIIVYKFFGGKDVCGKNV